MPAEPSTDSVAAPFGCTYPGCSAKYRRKEHLKRHILHHDQADHISCPDLLRRHIRVYHPQQQLPPSRAQKACSACRARKERCKGGFPCSKCQQRGIICSFADTATSNDEHSIGRNVNTVQRLPDLQTTLPLPIPTEPSSPDSGISRWNGQDYVDIYFDVFHPVWPILHKGTFDPAKEPCVLAQSIVMIGLWTKGGHEARDAAMYLYHKLRSAIRAQRDRWDISDPRPDQNNAASWPMATYQAVLLHVIFALFIAQEKGTSDLSLRYRIEAEEFGFLVALVQSCRRLDMFSYANMLTRYDPAAPHALVWLGVEEVKRFGLALYKVSRMCSCSVSVDGNRSQLLSLADLTFCMPDSDEVWNAPNNGGREVLKDVASRTNLRESGDPQAWISSSASVLYDRHVNFDWI